MSKLNEKLDWDQDMSRMASEIDKVFRYAKIKILKHIPYKRGFRRGDAALYGAFIHVKDKDGQKTVLPIEIDKKGIIRYAGGPNNWHPLEKIGALNMSHRRPDDFLKIKTYARTADYLKQFAKMPGFGQDIIYKKKKKEGVHEYNNAGREAVQDHFKSKGYYRKNLIKVEKFSKSTASFMKRGEIGMVTQMLRDIKEEVNDVLRPIAKEFDMPYIVRESTFKIKVDAYQDVMNALDKYITILKKQGIKKKAKIAMQMLKNLQKSFFAKEGFEEVAMPAKEKQVQAIKSISQLISIAAGEEADDVFERPKPSAKALKAALKLVNKVK